MLALSFTAVYYAAFWEDIFIFKCFAWVLLAMMTYSACWSDLYKNTSWKWLINNMVWITINASLLFLSKSGVVFGFFYTFVGIAVLLVGVSRPFKT